MRFGVKTFAGLLLCIVASPALAGITVTSYTTAAGTNAYAPLSKDQYFDQQTLSDVSPAVADVSDDWTGTNIGGSIQTWHWVGSAHISTGTSLNSNNLFATGAGSFSYELTTTADFVDPRNVTTVYSPGAGADYQCYFTLDTAAAYVATTQLGQNSSLSLSSFENGFIFKRVNGAVTPLDVEVSGAIPPGHYEIHANTGLGAENLSSGSHQIAYSGRFNDLSFRVEVPEPQHLSLILGVLTLGMEMRQRR